MPPVDITKILHKFRRETWFPTNDIKHRPMEDLALEPNPESPVVYPQVERDSVGWNI